MHRDTIDGSHVTFDSKNHALVIAVQVFELWEFARVSIDYGLKEIRFDRARLVSAQPA